MYNVNLDRSKKPRSGSIIDPSRSRRACIFPLLITCPNWSITLITVSYGGEASRNDKNLSSLSLQASFHPRVIPASPETGGGRAHLQRRNLSPAGKNQPRFGSVPRRGERGGAAEATPLLPPRGLAHFWISPFSRFDPLHRLRRRLFPSNEAGSLPLPAPPTNRGASTRKTKKSERRSQTMVKVSPHGELESSRG